MAEDDENEKDIPQIPLDEEDIAVFKTYASGPYDDAIRKLEEEIKELTKKINETRGVKECDTGLAPRNQWDLNADLNMMAEEVRLKIYKCKSIHNPDSEDARYLVVSRNKELCVSSSLSPTDVEEGMRVGLNKKDQIALALPPRIDNKIKMLTVEDIPNVTYDDVGGCKEEIRQIREDFSKFHSGYRE